jgi:ATPase subunit of ABC transporter with duplicated ATPase domains
VRAGSTRSARADGELSGGERKQARARGAALGEAAVLLLDEPDNFLDVPAKLELERRIGESAKTVLMISHDRDLLGAASARSSRSRQRRLDARRLLPQLSRGARAAPAAARGPARAVAA